MTDKQLVCLMAAILAAGHKDQDQFDKINAATEEALSIFTAFRHLQEYAKDEASGAGAMQ